MNIPALTKRIKQIMALSVAVPAFTILGRLGVPDCNAGLSSRLTRTFEDCGIYSNYFYLFGVLLPFLMTIGLLLNHRKIASMGRARIVKRAISAVAVFAVLLIGYSILLSTSVTVSPKTQAQILFPWWYQQELKVLITEYQVNKNRKALGQTPEEAYINDKLDATVRHEVEKKSPVSYYITVIGLAIIYGSLFCALVYASMVPLLKLEYGTPGQTRLPGDGDSPQPVSRDSKSL